MTDSLILEVAEFEHDVLTGIYSEELAVRSRCALQCRCD